MSPTKQFDGIMGVTPTDDATVELDFNTVRERKGTNCVVCNSAGYNPSVTNYFNQRNLPSAGSLSQANFGSNPNEMMYFHCWWEAENSTTDPSSRSFLINITFNCLLSELKDLGQS